MPSTTVEVVGHYGLLERDPTAHTDIDQTLVARLPLESSGGLNQVITLASPGVVADANGFFHPIGDHAQTQFSIDNQPVTDQQSRPLFQPDLRGRGESMEVITGVPPAEFGDKDSLVVRIVTKSGLGEAEADRQRQGRLRIVQESRREFNLGAGRATRGLPVRVSGLKTDRFLDPPEFETLHGTGNSQSLFNRIDHRPNAVDTLHVKRPGGPLVLRRAQHLRQAAAGQAQHQQIRTTNVAPGYTRILSSKHTADGRCLRPPGSRDVRAERRPVHGHARERVAGPHADESRRQGGRRVADGGRTT